MADDDKIIVPIDADTSAFDAKVDASFEKASKGTGSRSGDSGGDNGGGKTPYINVEREVLGESSEGAAESTADIRLFREALHALHPALSELGIGVGELGPLVSAARGGIIALAAAIGGLFVAALEKAGDAANAAASKLGAFSDRGFAGGKEQYGALSETAGQLQTPTSELVDPFLQLTRLNQGQPKQDQQSQKDLLDGLATLVKGGQAENQGDASKFLEEASRFFAKGNENGIFGKEDFKALENIAPQTAAAIEAHLPKGQDTFNRGQVLGAIKGAGPEIDANALAAQAAQPEAISAAWVKVKAAYEKFEENAPHGDVIAKGLDKLADFFSLLGEARKRTKDAAEAEANAPHKFETLDPRVAENLRADNEQRNKRRPSQTPDDSKSLGAFDAEKSGSKKAEAEKASEDALKETSIFDSDLQKKLDEFHLRPEDAFKAKETDLAFRQAGIEKRYEPEETASKLQHAEISLQSAVINLAQATINGQEAQKNKALAGLSEESADENLNSAESRQRKAQQNLNKLTGNGPTEDTYAEQLSNAINERDAADTAVKKAKIEKKYSYLDESKADLAAQQAEQAIKSAQLEKNDASLRFRKEGESGPLTHELQQLKYSEALLKENESQTKYLEKLNLLQDILAKLDGLAKRPPKELLDDGKNKKEEEDNRNRAASAAANRADDYESAANRTGVRTIEGDKQAREQALAEGKNYGNERTVEGDRIARDKAAGRSPTDRLGSPDQYIQPELPKQPAHGARLNPADNEQGYNRPPRQGFVGPNEQGLQDSSNPTRQHFIGPNEQGYNSLGRYEDYGNKPPSAPQPVAPHLDTAPIQDFSANLGSGSSALQEFVSALNSASAATASKSQGDEASHGNAAQPVNDNGDSGGSGKDIGQEASDLKDALSSLAGDVIDAGASIKDAAGGEGHASGGYIRGPGTSTSDSIPAMLSDREYVHSARATEHWGVQTMHELNALQVPSIFQNFNLGGLALRIGRATAPPIALASGGVARSAPAAAGSEMEHFGTVDLRHETGTYRVATERDTMRHIAANAQRAKRFSTGNKPNWFGG